MNDLTVTINQQIEFNQGKNFFYKDLDALQFTNETVNAISHINILSPSVEQFLIDYTTNKAIEEFCRVNQYYSFDSKSRNELRKIYAELLECIQTKSNSSEEISKTHYRKLKQWIINNNPFAERIYKGKKQQVDIVTCSQYNPALQIKLLKINLTTLNQPILDIGCGKDSFLVNYLAEKGIDVFGIDRFKFTSFNLITSDWLEYDYGEKKWGTIISNLGFTNHFQHHNLRIDGKYIEYAEIYMKILRSLKVGGQFHYAPDLPFIEKYLDSKQFSINKYDINKTDYKTTVIKRLE
ncbi:MAG: class I SAM-dependent methyltransferase [Chitinophagaceae bacterium]|nr:class I SAM-dependent methyltransferase [Chitinophagaceae bacterium]